VFSGIAIWITLFFGGPFLYGAFKAIQWRWWVSGIRFGEVSFASDIKAKNLYGLYWKVTGWLLLIIILMSVAISGAVMGAVYLGPGEGTFQQKLTVAGQQWHVVIPVVVCYVFAALMATAVVRIYLVHDLVARVAKSTIVHNIAAAENVTAQGEAANAIGEGLADSLEIFGF
jgi:uncharacterized membrane protein YjgN (DUF898 family)